MFFFVVSVMYAFTISSPPHLTRHAMGHHTLSWSIYPSTVGIWTHDVPGDANGGWSAVY